MRRFEMVQSTTETTTSHAGLALVGRALAMTGLDRELRQIPLRHGIAHADCVKSYVGLLCTGKSDFDAIENKRNDTFFITARARLQHSALDRARGPPRRGCADPARGETPTPQDRDAGTRVRGGPRRRERAPAGAQVLAPLPCLSELRGRLRQARGRLTSPALDPCAGAYAAPRSAKPAGFSAAGDP